MATYVTPSPASRMNAIPLLDATDLPFADDWALLEAIQADAEMAGDFESDADRFGRCRLTAAFDD